jgi:hypothetical protein
VASAMPGRAAAEPAYRLFLRLLRPLRSIVTFAPFLATSLRFTISE